MYVLNTQLWTQLGSMAYSASERMLTVAVSRHTVLWSKSESTPRKDPREVKEIIVDIRSDNVSVYIIQR